MDPDAVDDEFSTDEGTELTGNIMGNDDQGNGPATVTQFDDTSAKGGTVSVGSTGDFTYVPAEGFTGVDTFTYTITDSDGDKDTAEVTITVKDINDEPEVLEDAYDVTEDVALVVDDPALGVLGNDTDADAGDSLTATIATQAAHGVVVLALDGTFTYTPDPDYNGSDSFTYQATDGVVTSDPVTVTLLVSAVDDAVDDSATTNEGTPIVIDVLDGSSPDGAMADNFEDVNAEVITLIGLSSGTTVTTAQGGTAELNADGTVTYTPASGFAGQDTFDYEVETASGDGNETATVTITVKEGSDPSVSIVYADGEVGVVDEGALDSGSTPLSSAESTSGSFTIAHSGTDTTAKLEVEGLDVTNGGVVTGEYGTLTVTNTAGVYTWDYDLDGSTQEHPEVDSVDTSEGIRDSFTVTVTDSSGDEASSSLAIEILDDGPTAVDDGPIALDEGSSVNINVIANDTAGADGVDLVEDLDVVAGPANGTLVYKNDGTFDYTPNENFSGSDQFTYSITDGDGDSDTATVDINVAPVASPPEAAIDVRYIGFEANDIEQTSGVVLGGQLAGDGNIFGTDGLNITETHSTVINFGPEFAGQTVDIDITAQIGGSWNWDGGVSGDGSYFEDNWTLTVNDNFFGSFLYNSDSTATEATVAGPNGPIYTHGTAGNANDNINFTDVIRVENVVVNAEGNVVLDYTAATTETAETVTIQAVAAIDLPDTYIYEIDISAAVTAPGETLTVQLTGTNSGSLTSKTGNTTVTENPAGSGMWDITFDPADATNISDVLELQILENTNFQLDLVATSTDDGDTSSTTASSATWTDGTFVDGIVEGMQFSTSSGLHGITDASGTFQYQEGDTISFSVGNVVIGSFASSAMADGVVFLQEIAGVGLEDLNDDYVEKMAVFLQSLDNDADAYNGIVISSELHEAFSDESFDLATMSKADLHDVLLENGITPVSEDDAMIHVKDMITEHAGLTEFDERESSDNDTVNEVIAGDDGANDTLIGTEGSDDFVWHLSEDVGTSDSPAIDKISDFSVEDGDRIVLHDLLDTGDEDLTDYINVELSGEDTVISVSTDGANVDQIITLTGVDLVTDAGDQDSIIQGMIDQGMMDID